MAIGFFSFVIFSLFLFFLFYSFSLYSSFSILFLCILSIFLFFLFYSFSLYSSFSILFLSILPIFVFVLFLFFYLESDFLLENINFQPPLSQHPSIAPDLFPLPPSPYFPLTEWGFFSLFKTRLILLNTSLVFYTKLISSKHSLSY